MSFEEIEITPAASGQGRGPARCGVRATRGGYKLVVSLSRESVDLVKFKKVDMFRVLMDKEANAIAFKRDDQGKVSGRVLAKNGGMVFELRGVPGIPDLETVRVDCKAEKIDDDTFGVWLPNWAEVDGRQVGVAEPALSEAALEYFRERLDDQTFEDAVGRVLEGVARNDLWAEAIDGEEPNGAQE